MIVNPTLQEQRLVRGAHPTNCTFQTGSKRLCTLTSIRKCLMEKISVMNRVSAAVGGVKIPLWSFAQIDKGGCTWDSSSLCTSLTEVIFPFATA